MDMLPHATTHYDKHLQTQQEQVYDQLNVLSKTNRSVTFNPDEPLNEDLYHILVKKKL